MGFFSSLNSWIASVITRIIDLFYIHPISRFVPRQIFRYFSCGVGNYILLDAVLYFVTYHYIISLNYIHIWHYVISPHVASLIIVFPITFFTGFWLNRYVAFNATLPAISAQVFRYALSVAGSVVLSYVVIKLLVEQWGVWATPAKILCSIITAVYSYLMARLFTFTEKRYR